jgi:adenylate kinase family enzyme
MSAMGSRMRKIAVFGKPGSGKSRLSKSLASTLGIQLHQLDSILYENNGELVAREIFEKRHEDILSSDSWIIDGFCSMESFNKRIAAADTLIYIDLPYAVSYWFVTKRLLKSLFVKPEGWPEGSSVLKGTLESYRVLKQYPKFWNDKFLNRLEEISADKSLYVIRSTDVLNQFFDRI